MERRRTMHSLSVVPEHEIAGLMPFDRGYVLGLGAVVDERVDETLRIGLRPADDLRSMLGNEESLR